MNHSAFYTRIKAMRIIAKAYENSQLFRGSKMSLKYEILLFYVIGFNRNFKAVTWSTERNKDHLPFEPNIIATPTPFPIKIHLTLKTRSRPFSEKKIRFHNLLAHIKVSLTLQNKTNLLVGVQMFLEEVLQFVFIVKQAFTGTGDLLMRCRARIKAWRIN